MHTAALLEVNSFACYKDEDIPLFSDVNFTVNEGDVIVLRGASGSGKTSLLKCLAHLDLYSGQLLFKGSPPQAHGIPAFRTEVMYIPQRPSLLPLTPKDFMFTIMSFYSRRHAKSKMSAEEVKQFLDKPMQVGENIGIGRELWDRNWTELSGGEAQRVMLAIGSSLGTAEILLFDEPTSALDAETTQAVQKFVLAELRKPDAKLKAIVWITHSEEQAQQVGTRFFTIANGKCQEDFEANLV